MRQIVETIEQNTEHRSLPHQEPSIGDFIYRDTQNVGFSEAKKKVEQYANLFNRGVIPNHLSCS